MNDCDETGVTRITDPASGGVLTTSAVQHDDTARQRAAYVLCYPVQPARRATRIVQIVLTAGDYEALLFTVDRPITLTAREARDYRALALPDGLVLRRVAGPDTIVGQDATYTITQTDEAPEGDSD